MLSSVCLFVVLLGAVSGSANDVQMQIANPNGIAASMSPKSISIFRVLPGTTMSPPTTPVGTQPPPMTTPQSPPTSPATVSGSSSTSPPMPSQPMSNPSPSPTGSTIPPTVAPVLTTGWINISVASIRELDINFTQVASSSPYNMNGFPVNSGSGANPIPPPTNMNIPGSNPTVQLNCQSINNVLYPVFNTTTLTINVCAVLTNGTVNFDTESSQVAMGQLVLSATIMGWPWTSAGSYLEFNLTVSVLPGRQMSVTTGSSSPLMIGLGTSDSYALFSTKTTNPVFSAYMTMPAGYPMLTQDKPVDNIANVTAMFPRTDSTVVWNAVVEPGYQPSQKPPGSVSAAESLVVSLVMQAVAAVLACFVGSFDRRQ